MRCQRVKGRQTVGRRVHLTSPSGMQQTLFSDEIQFAQSDSHYYNLHLRNVPAIKVRMPQSEILKTLGDRFLSISRGLVVNVNFIRQLGTKFCILEEGREVLLSRNNLNAIHTAYAAHVSKQLTRGDYETSMISEYIGDDTEASS